METTRISRSRRAIVAAALFAALVPFGATQPAVAACDPLVPPEVCALIPPAVHTPPVDQTGAMGRTYVPANPAVKSGSNLYLHNFDSVPHFWVFSNGQSKRLGPGEFGPIGQKFQISVANGFVPGASYPFFCAAYPEMTGELTVT